MEMYRRVFICLDPLRTALKHVLTYQSPLQIWQYGIVYEENPHDIPYIPSIPSVFERSNPSFCCLNPHIFCCSDRSISRNALNFWPMWSHFEDHSFFRDVCHTCITEHVATPAQDAFMPGTDCQQVYVIQSGAT